MKEKKSVSIGSTRAKTVKLKTAKGRSASSQRWLRRQLNDPYVQEAQRRGYRSRSAFKLLQLDQKFDLFKAGHYVIDLGAAPGGWTQVASDRINSKSSSGKVVGLDILPIEPITGATLLQADFMTEIGYELLLNTLEDDVNVVLSDMAAPTTGHTQTDHTRTVGLCEAAYEFAVEVLSFDGSFVAKVFKGGSEQALLNRMKQEFKTVKHAKPDASRPESPETYVVALGFRGKLTSNKK